MVFAINKIDKPGADPNRIRTQLAEMNLLVEDWGGEYQCQEIAAKFGTNVDLLLEKVILEADILGLRANPDRSSLGTVIESRLDKGRGNVATLLVQNGSLKVGDALVAGIHFGKVRTIIDQNGKRLQEAGPSMPVQVTGLSGLPTAGDKFLVYDEESKAREIATKRQELFREQQFRQNKRLTLDEITRRRAVGRFEQLNVIVKADVNGSAEALTDALLQLSTEEVQVNVILKGVGAITESDVLLASASEAIIIAFNVRPNAQARVVAQREGVDIRNYNIIYNAIAEVRSALEGLLSPDIKEDVAGQAEVRDVFKITGIGMVSGCYVTEGKVMRNNLVRVIRDNVVIHEGKLNSLKRFKDDVKEVATGYECGIQINNYNDIQVGDIIESYTAHEVRRKLD
jgi:translation initiation factor IF-2